MTLDEHGNFVPWMQPSYGCDAENKPLEIPAGWVLVPQGWPIQVGDVPYDVYAGWLEPTDSRWHAINGYRAQSSGRWTAWRRVAR